MDNSELERLRGLAVLDVLHLMAVHTKLDRAFASVRAFNTQRVQVTAAGADWELVVDGACFFDTRERKGGGGAVDLVMHLWRVPFKQAVKMLREVGA
ncbi:hypothetical protein [Burkholderia multivorans]|uniref:hypothetical protein n=1 Tax=Burkholderia multivorans TaxID=87883 RepID=UPI0021C20B4C|nr:hypothetical protein [Burkholderia multivorans]